MTETNAERLKGIKERNAVLINYMDEVGNGEVHVQKIHNDMNWLIEQAEQVQKLKRLADEAHEHMTFTKQEHHKLQGKFMDIEEELTRKNEALEFYADEANHIFPIYDEHGQFNGSLVGKDEGKKARQALEVSE